MSAPKQGGSPGPLKAIIFDYGNVLSFPEPPESEARRAVLCGLGIQEFRRAYRRHRPDYDRGSVNGEEYWRRVVGEKAPAPAAASIEALIQEDTKRTAGLDPEMLDWAAILVEHGYKLAILSNMTVDDMRVINADSIRPRLDAFSPTLFSSECGLVKPQKEIYLRCLEALSVRPEQALFIDDTTENTHAAERLGMAGCLFESPAKSVPFLVRKFGLPGLRRFG
jgi:putative hydrolase of the HAD superfamily